MNAINYLAEKINNAKSLDFGNVFNDSIELFKKVWLQGFIMQLLVLVMVLPFLIVIYVPLIMIFISQSQSGYHDPSEFDAFFAGFGIFYMVLFFIAILVLSAVSLAINAAFYRIVRDLDQGKEMRTSDFFYFLKGKYLSKAFVLVIIIMLISIIATLLCVLPMFYVMVPIYYFTIIFAFNPELSVGDMISVGFKLGNKKWLLTFGLIIVTSILASIVGMILCGIGALFTSAFIYLPIYIIYKEVIGFQNDSIDEIKVIGEQVE